MLAEWTGMARYGRGNARWSAAGPMFWEHTDTDTYLRMLTAAGLHPRWHRYIPEGDTGHTLVLCRTS